MTTGQLIKKARRKAGMTQADLAEKLGISYVGISQWENGTRNPKYDTIRRIANALGIEWTELVPEEEQAAIVIEHTMKGIKEAVKTGGFERVPDWKTRQYFAKAEIQRIYNSLNTDGCLEAGEYLLSFLLNHLSYEGAEHDLEEVMTKLASVASIPQYQQYNAETQEDSKNG